MKVVLKHGGTWLHFSHPEKVLRTERVEEVLPLLLQAETSGLFAAGYVSYEAAPAFDPALKTRSPGGFPLLCLGLFNAPDICEQMADPMVGTYELGPLQPSVSKEEFSSAIGKIKERIAEGATYQVNYTYRLTGSFSGDAWPFFCELVKGQNAQHAAFVETDNFAICSASPELFFITRDGLITSRPMKGTARRGRTFAEDWRQAESLRQSEKDRAENIMIVDMIRNDIGRIAEPGSVQAVSTYDVEKYPTVWQMTSTVTGKLAPGRKDVGGNEETHSSAPLQLCAIFEALFPCASVTGAPKTKTMEIIRDLETTPRNIYTGSIGFMDPRGEACFNVAIRTALIDKANGLLQYGVGGGIVWDSDAESEYEETLTKARVLTQSRPDFQLLETMLWQPGTGIFLLNEHMQRLGKSAAYFDIPLDAFEIQGALDRMASEYGSMPMRLRLLVSRDGSFEVQDFPLEEGRACSPSAPQILSFVEGQTSRRDVPTLTVAIAKKPVDSQDVFLFHKTTHRAVYENARADFPGCDEVILWNERGEVTEGCISNVVVLKNGKRITPPIECGLLAGTFRDHLLKNGEVVEGLLTIDDLRSADEIYLINSVRRWQHARLDH